MTQIIRLTNYIVVVDSVACRFDEERGGYYPIREDLKDVTITSRNGNVITKHESIPKHPRFLIGFCMLIDVDINTIHDWAAKYPEFHRAYTRAKELYKEHLGVCGALGLFNSQFTQFLAKNTTDWTDKNIIEHEGKIDSTHFFESMVSKAQKARDWQRN